MIVSGKPPQRDGLDRRRGRTRRRASARRTPRARRTHSGASHGFQNGRQQLATSSATMQRGRDRAAATALRTDSGRTGSAGHFSAITPQQAPAPRARGRPALSGRDHRVQHRPVEKRRHQRTAAARATISVAERVHPVAEEVAPQPGERRPRCATGGGAARDRREDGGAPRRSSLLDRRAAVVPVHERRGEQRHREVDRHHDARCTRSRGRSG